MNLLMNMCVEMCVIIYLLTHTYMYLLTHIYIYILTFTCICIGGLLSWLVFGGKQSLECVYIYKCVPYMYKCIDAYIHMHPSIHVYVYIYIHIHISIYAYIGDSLLWWVFGGR